MATILDLALPDGSNLLADLSHTPAKPDNASPSTQSARRDSKDDVAARHELVFKLVKKDGGFAISIGTAEANVLLAMLAAGATAP